MMTVEEAVAGRRSIRAFLPKPVPRELIERRLVEVVERGMEAEEFDYVVHGSVRCPLSVRAVRLASRTVARSGAGALALLTAAPLST